MELKKKYEKSYTDLKITENSFMMTDDFRQQIEKRNIQLEKKDLDDLKNIISMTGTTLDIRTLAKNIKDYVERV